jgi:membrane protein YdbS with pleckstrin-like domain
VTPDAVHRSKGLFGESEHRVLIADIESVSVRESPLDRLFDIGTVMLQTKDGTHERLVGLKGPDVIRRKIEALLTPVRRA